MHTHPAWGVTYVFLNTSVPPFNDLRARRAANLAANRLAALPASAQNVGSQPTCQILPPNFPGFRRYCPYTVDPSPNGAWKGPDLRQARRLVAASGTRGMPVTIWVPPNQTSEGPVAAGLMRSLGYRARLENVGTRLYYSAPEGPQAGVSSWFADYPGASNFYTDFLCTVYVRFCGGQIGADIRRALSLPTTDPHAADRLWAKIDHEMVVRAPVVPLITHKAVDFVSKRVGNYTSNPNPYGVLLDQLWVR